MTDLASLIQFNENKINMLQKAERLERDDKRAEANAIISEWMHLSIFDKEQVLK